MSKLTRKWISLSFHDPDALTSTHIPIDNSSEITINDKLTTLSLSADNLYSIKANLDSPIFINRITIPFGSYNNPSIQFNGDEDTGIYRPGANQVGITTNGTAKLIVNNVKTEIFNELICKKDIDIIDGYSLKYNGEEISANNLKFDEFITIKNKIDNLVIPDNKIIYKIKSENYTIQNRDYILADTSDDSFTITFPSNPINGDYFQIIDAKGTFSINPLNIYSEKLILDEYNEMSLDVNNSTTTFVYVVDYGWKILENNKSLVLERKEQINYKYINDDYISQNNEYLLIDTSEDEIDLTLPINPSIGNYLQVLDAKGTFNTNNVNIISNKNIFGDEYSSFKLDVDKSVLTFVFLNEDYGWTIIEGNQCVVIHNTNYKIINDDYYINPNEKILVDAVSSFTLYLPSGSKSGDFVEIKYGDGDLLTNHIIIDRNNAKIKGEENNIDFDIEYGELKLIYFNDDKGWIY